MLKCIDGTSFSSVQGRKTRNVPATQVLVPSRVETDQRNTDMETGECSNAFRLFNDAILFIYLLSLIYLANIDGQNVLFLFILFYI